MEMGKVREGLISKYAAISVVVGPILQPYNLYGKSVASVLMFMNIVILGVYGLIKGKRSFIKPDRSYITFLLYCLTLPVLLGLLLYSVDIGSSFRGILVFSACLLCYISFVSFDYLKQAYRFFVFAAIVVYVAQEFCFLFLGFRFPALIPFFELNYEMGMEEFLKEQLIKDRSSSFFLEPAHLAIFVLPYLTMLLVDNSRKKKFFSIESVFITLFLIYVRSGVGAISMLFLYGLVFLNSHISSSRKLSVLIVAVIVIGLAFSIESVRSFFYDSFFSRSVELVGDSSNESGLKRVTRGFMVYSDFPLIGKMFGVSNGAIEDVIRHSSAASLFGEETYLNNIQKLLIGYGFIGVFLLFRYMFSTLKRRNIYSLYVMAIFTALCFMEIMPFEARMMLYFAIAALPLYKVNKGKHDKKSIYNH